MQTKKLLVKSLQKNFWWKVCNAVRFWPFQVYLYGPKKDLFVSLELTSSEKVILWYRDTTAKYNLSDISLEYDAIFDECYDATTKYEFYAETASQ